MRQRYKPWADDFLQEHTDLVLADPLQHKYSWQSYFANNHPIHLEIGTGKGQFLAGMAEQQPEINFIGMEIAKSIVVTAAQKILDADLGNVVLLNEDASKMQEFFGENEISTIYLNFSDPWPKNRHEKRRLTFHKFLEQYKNILHASGEIILKTDNRELFEYSLVSFSQFGMKLEEVNLDLHAEEDPQNVMTEYEQKFSGKGQPIYRCVARFD